MWNMIMGLPPSTAEQLLHQLPSSMLHDLSSQRWWRGNVCGARKPT